MNELQTQIREYLVGELAKVAQQKNVPFDGSDDQLNLLDSGLVDSLGFLDLIATLESRFSVQAAFEDLEPETFTTLGGLCAALAGTSHRP